MVPGLTATPPLLREVLTHSLSSILSASRRSQGGVPATFLARNGDLRASRRNYSHNLHNRKGPQLTSRGLMAVVEKEPPFERGDPAAEIHRSIAPLQGLFAAVDEPIRIPFSAGSEKSELIR